MGAEGGPWTAAKGGDARACLAQHILALPVPFQLHKPSPSEKKKRKVRGSYKPRGRVSVPLFSGRSDLQATQFKVPSAETIQGRGDPSLAKSRTALVGRELFPGSIYPCTGNRASLLLFSDGTPLKVMMVIPPSHGPPKSVGETVIAVPAAALGGFYTPISFSPEPQVPHLPQRDTDGPFYLVSL